MKIIEGIISKQIEFETVEKLEELLTEIGFDDPMEISDIRNQFLTTNSKDKI